MSKRVPATKLLYFGLPVLGLLVGLVGYLALVAPQKSEAKRLDSQSQALESQLVTARRPAPKPMSARAADLFRLTKAMPDANDMPGILLDLSRLARASSVTIESVKPSVQVPLTQGYAALPLSVVLSGKFADVSNFLQLLRRQVQIGGKGRLQVDGRLLVANQVQLASTDGRLLSATLSLDAFVYGVAPPPSSSTTTTTTSATTGSTG
jgi:hypothetical protein